MLRSGITHVIDMSWAIRVREPYWIGVCCRCQALSEWSSWNCRESRSTRGCPRGRAELSTPCPSACRRLSVTFSWFKLEFDFSDFNHKYGTWSIRTFMPTGEMRKKGIPWAAQRSEAISTAVRSCPTTFKQKNTKKKYFQVTNLLENKRCNVTDIFCPGFNARATFVLPLHNCGLSSSDR